MPDGGSRAQRVGAMVIGAALLAMVSTTLVTRVGAETAAALTETPGCGATTEAPALPPVAARLDQAAVPVLAIIPASVFIWVDDGGGANKVATNTGCAPRPGDRFVAQHLGDPRQGAAASPALVDRVMGAPFSGDWRALGRWHEL